MVTCRCYPPPAIMVSSWRARLSLSVESEAGDKVSKAFQQERLRSASAPFGAVQGWRLPTWIVPHPACSKPRILHIARSKARYDAS